TGIWEGNWTVPSFHLTLTFVEGPGGQIAGAVLLGVFPNQPAQFTGTRIGAGIQLSGCPLPVFAAMTGCNQIHLIASGFQGEAFVGRVANVNCSDTVVEAGEECDDGNLLDGDGCNFRCQIERCGNANVEGSEQCDDGNLVNGDGCDSNCTLPRCGNGIVNSGE